MFKFTDMTEEKDGKGKALSSLNRKVYEVFEKALPVNKL